MRSSTRNFPNGGHCDERTWLLLLLLAVLVCIRSNPYIHTGESVCIRMVIYLNATEACIYIHPIRRQQLLPLSWGKLNTLLCCVETQHESFPFSGWRGGVEKSFVLAAAAIKTPAQSLAPHTNHNRRPGIGREKGEESGKIRGKSRRKIEGNPPRYHKDMPWQGPRLLWLNCRRNWRRCETGSPRIQLSVAWSRYQRIP